MITPILVGVCVVIGLVLLVPVIFGYDSITEMFKGKEAVKLTEVISFDCSSMTQPPDTSSWDTSSVTNFRDCWNDCSSMTQSPDTSSWDTSSVTNFSQCWAGCSFRSHDYDRRLHQLLASSPRSGVPMHGGSSKYTYQGKPSRDALLAMGWNIVDNGIDPN